MENFEDLVLGKSEGEHTLETQAECQAVVASMLRQAEQSLAIFSRDLDPALFNNSGFSDAVGHIVANHPHAKIRILAHDIEKALKDRNRVMEVVRRYPSHVQLRSLSRSYHHAFFVADGKGVLDRRQSNRFEAAANFNDPGLARDLLNFFNSTWDRSSPNSEARSFSL